MVRGNHQHGLLALAALYSTSRAQDVITDDAYFYGQSPPVYPSPQSTGTGDWSEALASAQHFLGQLTLEEKVNLTGGIVSTTGCAGTLPPVSRLGFPGICFHDSSGGLKSTDSGAAWAAPISIGASFNRELAQARATGIAIDFKNAGANVMLGPTVGPLGRHPTGGRNWEGYSNDPYLTGVLTYDTVKSTQEVGVMATIKHMLGNEQDNHRFPNGDVEALSANIDDKTLHELYLWPFADALYAGSATAMCSYTRLNNSYGCQNSKLLNDILKTELGFQGPVMTDWYAQRGGVSSALAGLDIVMPSPVENSGLPAFWGPNLTEAINNGSVPEWRLDDMVTRTLAAWYKLNQSTVFTNPGYGVPKDITKPHPKIAYLNTTWSKQAILQSAIESHVLVKNVNSTLPLKSPRLLSLFGYSAKASDRYNVGDGVWNMGQEAYPYATTNLSNNADYPYPQIAPNGTLITGGGAASSQPPYISSPFEALSQRAYEDGFRLFWDWTTFNPSAIDGNTDACLVFGNAFSSEGWDRTGLHDDYTDGLILNVAANCSNTIVVMHNVGVRLVDQFIDHPNVTAVIFAHLPGQDSGRALTKLLFGDVNFSAKLPYTVAHNESDYAGLDKLSEPEGQYALFPQSNYDEGVYIDYRAFDAKNITPRYEFGFGLSYTTFAYADLQTSVLSANLTTYPTGPVLQGGEADLWDVVATVSATVSNTGDVTGAEAAQLYVGIPGAPLKQLRGFEKPTLEPGASATVTFELKRRDLSVWDVVAQKWLLQKGNYKIYVGGSSRDLPLSRTLEL